MALTRYRPALIASLLAIPLATAHAQAFTVGEKSATADIATDFSPTHVPLPQGKLTERGRRELIRNLEAEQGFAHRALPISSGITLQANGQPGSMRSAGRPSCGHGAGVQRRSHRPGL